MHQTGEHLVDFNFGLVVWVPGHLACIRAPKHQFDNPHRIHVWYIYGQAPSFAPAPKLAW